MAPVWSLYERKTSQLSHAFLENTLPPLPQSWAADRDLHMPWQGAVLCYVAMAEVITPLSPERDLFNWIGPLWKQSSWWGDATTPFHDLSNALWRAIRTCQQSTCERALLVNRIKSTAVVEKKIIDDKRKFFSNIKIYFIYYRYFYSTDNLRRALHIYRTFTLVAGGRWKPVVEPPFYCYPLKSSSSLWKKKNK